ncbi:MAG: ankyrin repeat domain-containing protein [Leptospiraceae bacterium]|nr:ankyrin repeat domain-containing protein [Leptospiraceae bacterium]
MHYACSKWNSDVEIVKLLVENKADVNAQNKQGWTPLHNAFLQVNLELVKYLLNQAADKNIRTLDGKTALDLAKESYPSFGKAQDKLDIIFLLENKQ